MSLKIRQAKLDDIEWVNQKYDKVEFPHSNFDNKFIAIAEFDNQKVRIGRLININGENAEMGGMYVFEEYRNQGIASEIIKFLLKNSNKFENIFCLPFENLEKYYGKFGFIKTLTENYPKVPEKILKKHHWCNETFHKKVLLP